MMGEDLKDLFLEYKDFPFWNTWREKKKLEVIKSFKGLSWVIQVK